MDLVFRRPGKGPTLPAESGGWLLEEVALPEKRAKQAGGKDGKAERVKGCHGFGEGAESQAAEGT